MHTTNSALHAAPARRRFIPRLRWKLVIGVVCLLLGIGAWSTLRGGEGPTMKGMGENRTTSSQDGTTIAFTKLGAGPSVILVDGAFCYRDNGPAPELAPLLAQHFTVFAYDRRGRGESGDTSPYAIDREIDDLRAILREAGGSAFVVGVSSGAALAMQGVASGLNITKLALYEPPYVPNGGTGGDHRGRLQQLLAAGDRRGAVKYFLADVYGAPRAFVLVMPFIMRSTWKKNESVVHTLPNDLTIMSDWSVLKERSASISVPTLVVGGEKSPETLRSAVTTVTNALPNARSRFLAGQTHDLSAAALAPVLLEFFGVE